MELIIEWRLRSQWRLEGAKMQAGRLRSQWGETPRETARLPSRHATDRFT